MNDKDRMYDYLKLKRKMIWAGQYIDIALILILWFIGLKFWAAIAFILLIIGMVGIAKNLKKNEKEIFGKEM